ncbi:CCR4-NOT core subunit cdc39, partial [Linderina macrospora]
SGPAETAPAIPVTSAANAVPAAPIIPVSARSQETASYQQILFNWTRVCEHPAASETELTTLVQQLSQQVPLHDHGVSAAFFCANIESVVDFYDRSIAAARAGAGAGAGARAGGSTSGIGYQVADALAKLVVYLIKLGPKDSDGKADIDILRMFLSSIVLVIVQMHTTQPDVFSAHQRPLFRIMASLLHELNVCRRAGEPWCGSDRTREMAQAIGDSLALLNPSFVPGFSFSWLMLVSHRHFFPLLMQEKGLWPLASQLLAELIGFLQPFIVANQVVDSLKLLYRGMVCVILVVLHDYPEFLAEYALSLCNGIPTNCVQLRNLLLSAYPREMRLPEPLAPNLKIDLLPDVSRSPPIPFEYVSDLEKAELKDELVSYLKGEAPATAIKTMASRLFAKTSATEQQAVPSESCYSVKLINAFVLHAVVTITAMEDSAARETSQRMALDMIRQMLGEADAEASYLLVNAVANQLRFPSSHTYLCSRIVLALFSKSDERVREHIARALVERILVNRPFPWGLLVTLIELLRNPYYSFWDRPFTKRSPQITEILQAVAKSIHPIGTPTQHQAHGAEAANAANSAAQVAISQPPSHA